MKLRHLFCMIALAGLLLYPLSAGPVMRILAESDPFANPSFATEFDRFYRPLGFIRDRCPPFRNVMNWYLKLWVPTFQPA